MLEVDAATDVFLKANGKPRAYRQLTSMIIINVIHGICFGTRCVSILMLYLIC